MKISDVPNFWLERYLDDGKEVRVNSLKRACELAVERGDPNTLIHIGGYNLDYYRKGDTVETLYQRCADIIHRL